MFSLININLFRDNSIDTRKRYISFALQNNVKYIYNISVRDM